jgi:acyl dehydratase
MSVVEYLKDKERLLRQQLKSVEFKTRFEPQFRELSEKLSQTINNTLNTPWLGKFSLLLERENLTPLTPPPVITAEARAFYEKWHTFIGQQTHLGDWLLIDQDRINQFAFVTEDNQWIHTDVDRAAEESPFGTTIAHGFLTLALLPKLTESSNDPYPEARMLVNYGLNKVRFPYPVKAGSEVRARTLLKDVIPSKRCVDLVSEISVEINGSKRLACVAETLLRVYL